MKIKELSFFSEYRQKRPMFLTGSIKVLWRFSRKESACNSGDLGSISGSGRSPGAGHGYSLQYSLLENPVDRGAWRASVNRVAQSWTRLWLSSSSNKSTGQNVIKHWKQCSVMIVPLLLTAEHICDPTLCYNTGLLDLKPSCRSAGWWAETLGFLQKTKTFFSKEKLQKILV